MFLDLAKKRRSIRQFNSEEVSEKDLNSIIEATLLAPSAKNRKPCEYIVVRDKQVLAELSQFKKANAHFIKDAQVAIVVLVDKETAGVTYSQDASIVATFIQLAAADLGIGTCWANVVGGERSDGEDSESFLKRFLNIPEKYGVESVIALGHYDKEPAPLKEKDLSSKIHFDKYS